MQQDKHLILDKNTDIAQKSSFHIIPFQLSNNCEKVQDCQVSNYFLSTVSTQINSQNQNELTGTIHGHKVVGTKYQDLNNLYSCLCYRKPQTSDIQMIAIQKIENITEWRKDITWKKNQGHIGSTMLYNQLMEVLHSDVISGDLKDTNQDKNRNQNKNFNIHQFEVQKRQI